MQIKENTHKIRLFKLLFMVMTVLFLGQHESVAQDVQDSKAENILNKLESSYQSLSAIKASFTQTLASDYTEETSSMSGTMLLKGENYRLEMKEQTLVTDGTTSWIFLPSDNQVLINNVENDDTVISPSDFFSLHNKDYTASFVETETVNGSTHDHIKLSPSKKNSYVAEAHIWVRRSDNMPTKVRIKDENQTSIVFELSSIEKNPIINQSTFTMDIPSGAEVIDLRL